MLEAAVLFSILAAINLVAAGPDVGWLELNPSPFVLIPVLLGLRYGFLAGLGSGLGTVLLICAGRLLFDQGVGGHGFVLACLPGLGALVGVMAEELRKSRAEVERDNEYLQDENARLHAERELMILSQQDLQQRLSEAETGEFATLEEGFEPVRDSVDEFVPSQLLSTLARLTRVRSAALYRLSSGSPAAPLTREACIGSASKFPEHLYQEEHLIVAEAIRGGHFLVQKTILRENPYRSAGFLGAYPIKSDVEREDTYVLVVEDLPFTEVCPNTFDVMKSICDWMRYALSDPGERRPRRRTVGQTEFYQAIEAAVAMHKQQGVPSTLVRVPFDVPEGVDESLLFREVITSLPPETLLANSHEDGMRSLLFLFPAESKPTVLETAREALTGLGRKLGYEDRRHQPRFFTTNPGETPQQMWGRLVSINQDLASQ